MQRELRAIARPALLVLFAGGLLVMLGGYFSEVPALAAQRSRRSATLNGMVLGPDDKPVPHAGITYQSSAGRAPHAVHTDAHGRFTITKLRPDNYDLRASAKGIFSEWEKNVSLHPGESMYLTLRLIYTRQPLKPKAAKKSKQAQ
jgi:hypothetical protein